MASVGLLNNPVQALSLQGVDGGAAVTNGCWGHDTSWKWVFAGWDVCVNVTIFCSQDKNLLN